MDAIAGLDACSETLAGVAGWSRPFAWQGTATRTEQGPDVLATLPAALEGLGLRRVLLVTSPGVARGEAATGIAALLGDRLVAQLAAVPQHSHEDIVAEGVACARSAGIDGVVALGGGSVSDTAKAILIVLAEGGEISDHANVFFPPDRYEQKPLRRPKLPLIAIPTTASAAEVTPGLGIRAREGHKMVFWDPGVVPRLILLAPAAFADTPVPVLAGTGMNAFAHCVEGLYSRVRNPVSEALALHAARGLLTALPALAAAPGCAAARAEVMVWAHLSGHVIANARVGLHHAICHGLGTIGGLSHGDANAVMLPHVMRYNLDAARRELALLADAFGLPAASSGRDAQERAEAAVAAVVQLQRDAGVPMRLRDCGFDTARIGAIARATMSDRGAYFNPRPAPPEADVAALLEAAW